MSGTIRGDVGVLGIGSLLQVLADNDIKGVLTVSKDNEKKVIQYGPDGLRLAVRDGSTLHHLGEIILRSRKITRHQLEEMLREQKKVNLKLGEIIQAKGLMTKSDVDAALRTQVEEEIHDLFHWEGAGFEFVEGASVDPTKANPLAEAKLNPNFASVLLEAARRVDEHRLIRQSIPNDNLIPVRMVEHFPAGYPNLDETIADAIWPFVTGTMTVGGVMRMSLYPRFDVLRTLWLLSVSGAVEIRDSGKGRRVYKPVLPPRRRASDRPAPVDGMVLVHQEDTLSPKV